MSNIHASQLVNTVGHSAGAIIFGIFLYLLLQDRSGARLRGSWLSVAAAGLAFLWNAGSLAVLVAAASNTKSADLLAFFCFAVLSLLPAVLLHLSLDGGSIVLIGCGYALSLTSIALHLRELFSNGVQYHQEALLLITIGFAILTTISVAAIALQGGDRARRAKASRIFGAMCSALFAVSFVHFGAGHPTAVWSRELIFHHAGIPLALFVLLQDYRFVLLDAFVRFLTNVFLSAALTFAVFRAVAPRILTGERMTESPFYEALLLMGFCLLLIGFALLRNRAQRWLTRAVFRRPDLGKAAEQIRSRAALFSDESEFLPWAYTEIARFISAERIEEVSEATFSRISGGTDVMFPTPTSDIPSFGDSTEFGWALAALPLRIAHRGVRYLLLGRRRGGRRYLSEDLSALSRLATVILEEVERFRNSEMQRLVSQAELRALQSQINPHFLFNALNTLYGIIPREALGARKTVLHLADIFRYFLQSEKTFIRLSEELEIIQAYIDIERLRLGSRLQVEIDVDESARSTLIPVLSIQPLVENAIKHGISKKTGLGVLRLRVKHSGDGLLVTVEDSGTGAGSTERDRAHVGVGLANVKRRLQLCFGPDADLTIESRPDGTKVEFTMPAPKAVEVV